MIGKSNVFGKLKILWYMKLFMPKLKNITLYGEISQDTKKVLNKSRIQKTLCYTMIENSCIIASKQYKTLKKEITLSPKISLKLANLGGESEILITDKTILHSYTKDNKFVHSREEFKTGDIGSLKKGELHILVSSESVILDIRTHTVLDKEIIDDYLSKFKFIAESVIVKKQN
jgi:long-subunit acyl-CoA synthetase (AMP-forming)